LPKAREVIAPLVALPPLKVTGLPKFDPSIVNCTDPVGVAVDGATAVTVAVNVRLSLNTEGLSDEFTVVVVSAGFTTCVKLLEVLVVKLASPL
jgi:hypothetical protein